MVNNAEGLMLPDRVLVVVDLVLVRVPELLPLGPTTETVGNPIAEPADVVVLLGEVEVRPIGIDAPALYRKADTTFPTKLPKAGVPLLLSFK